MVWYAIAIALAIMAGSHYFGGKVGQTHWQRQENSVAWFLGALGFCAIIAVIAFLL